MTGRPENACRGGRRRAVSQRWLIDLLTDQLSARGAGLSIVDLGGGTGGVAATLAGAGHRVQVVDPSPDALAATNRRAAEAGITDRLTAVQGDTANLLDVVSEGSVDVVLCHRVLERVPGTAEALETMGRALASGGVLSLEISQRYQRLLKQAVAGNFAQARAILDDPELLDRSTLHRLLSPAGFTVISEHGIGVLADFVPESAAEGQSDQLLALEADASGNPAWLECATRLHLLAER